MTDSDSNNDTFSQLSLSSISSLISYDYRDEPLQLISYSPSLHSTYYLEFNINPEAIQFIRSLEAPISVITVAGLYRTGKSYLLNRVLLNRTSGFEVQSTTNACTKGLWIWGKPLRGTDSNGKYCSILVVDTEGIGSLE